jgi:hypothetical protein
MPPRECMEQLNGRRAPDTVREYVAELNGLGAREC